MDDIDITSTTCHDVDEKFDIDDENWDHCWKTTRSVTTSEQTRNRVVLRVLEEVHKHTFWWCELCHDEKCKGCSRHQVSRHQVWSRQWKLLAWFDKRRGAESVTSHENKSCKHMEDVYFNNDNINMTLTRFSVLITSESGDELTSLRGQFIAKAEQHILQHYHITERTTCATSELVGEQYSGPCGKSCCGLRTQQPSLVDANEFTLLSVLTRGWMMRIFKVFLGQSCFLSETSQRYLPLCVFLLKL